MAIRIVEMNNTIILFGLVLLLATSCGDYSDHKIIIKETKTNSLFDDVSIDLGVQGTEESRYDIDVLYKGESLSNISINSSFKPSTTSADLDFTNLTNNVLEFAFDIINGEKIELRLLFTNEATRKLYDTTLTVHFFAPPISLVTAVDLGDGLNELNSPFQASIISTRKRYPNLDDSKVYRIAFLNELLSNDQQGFHFFNPGEQLKVVKKGSGIKIKTIADTVFQHTIIAAFPARDNKLEEYGIYLEEVIRYLISSSLDTIQSDWAGKKVDSGFLIQGEKSSDYSGLIALYLINIDEIGQFTFQQIGSYLSDVEAPSFSNSSYCSEPSNPEIEGAVCLTNKHFYGWSPYSVAFVGKAYGDVKAIYVDNRKVQFTLTEEIYFKKKVHLDGGYNRVPVKIIDNVGNITESFIPITVTSTDEVDIDIDNNIDIDNY